MTHAIRPAAVPSTPAAATRPGLPRRPRIGAAIASAVVSCTLLASVVLGMAASGPGSGQIVAQGPVADRA